MPEVDVRHQDAVASAGAALPSDSQLVLVVETFQALGDPTRARILYALGTQTLCVGDLAQVVGVSESAVSQQLSCFWWIRHRLS